MTSSRSLTVGEAEARVAASRSARAEDEPARRAEESEALRALSDAYDRADRSEDAVQAARSGVEALAAAFLAQPARYAVPMRAIVAQYVTLAGRSGSPVDESLLAPIAQALGDLERRADVDDD